MESKSIPTSLGHLYFDFQQALILLENIEHRIQRHIEQSHSNRDTSNQHTVSALLDYFFNLDKQLSNVESQFEDLAKVKTIIEIVEKNTHKKTQAVLGFLASADHGMTQHFYKDIEQLRCMTETSLRCDESIKLQNMAPIACTQPTKETLQSSEPSLTPLLSTIPGTARSYSRLPHLPYKLLKTSDHLSRQYGSSSVLHITPHHEGISRCLTNYEIQYETDQNFSPIHHNNFSNESGFPSPVLDETSRAPSSVPKINFDSPQNFKGMISQAEFESVPLLLRRRITLEEVNVLYFFLLRIHSKQSSGNNCKRFKWITPKELADKGFIISGRKGIEKLIILRRLKRIELSKENHIRVLFPDYSNKFRI